MNEIKSISVLCGCESGNNPEFEKMARELAVAMINRDISLVFGGGNKGLMKVIADEFGKHEKTVIGVIPQEYVSHGIRHPCATETIIAKSMSERINTMKQLSDGFIALPGGFGTVCELFEVIYAVRLGILSKPCGVLNIYSFYDSLINFLDQNVENEFLNQSHRDILISSDNPDDLLDAFDRYEPVVFPRIWV